MKRLACVLLSAALLPSAAAAAGEDSADKLHDLGLFQGVVPGVYNTESKALDRLATRAEGLVMLVRVLGAEKEAGTETGPCPFSDVPGWAAGYVTYAYNNGLTSGTGHGLFGSDDPLTLDQYTTMLLRALNYVESQDFQWDSACAFAVETGLYSQAWLDANQGTQATRGALADASWLALNAPKKGDGETLFNELVPSADQPQDARAEILSLVNEARAEAGAPPLVLNDALCRGAQIRAEELVQSYSHTRPSGENSVTVLSQVGLGNYRAMGENIAKGQLTGAEVMEDWLGSPGHRANIENPSFTALGVGYAAQAHTWVQLFWAPME